MGYDHIVAIIPARIKSSRLPKKVLADIHGKPMVIRVAEKVKGAGINNIYIATDSNEVTAVCKKFNFNYLLTPDAQTGSDRLAIAVKMLELADHQLILNIQADEPLIDPEIISKLAEVIEKSVSKGILCATAIGKISNTENIFNPNVVKCVVDNNGLAHYFSRAAIPWFREVYPNVGDDQFVNLISNSVYHHFGIYIYQAGLLKKYANLAFSKNEQAEKLEQLRILDNGYQIQTVLVDAKPMPAVDTPEDLELVRKIYLEQNL